MFRIVIGFFALLAGGLGAEEVYRLAEGEVLPSDEAGKLEVGVDGLPEHGLLKLTLDLEVRVPRSQHGQAFSRGERESREMLKIVAGQKVILNASFSASHFSQSFPDAHGGFCHPPQTGSKKGWAGSQRYQFELVIPHGEDALELRFAWLAKFPQKMPGRIEGQEKELKFIDGGEPFIVRGLVVETVKPLKLDRDSAREILDQISGDDPVLAHAAVQKLVQSGEAALPYVRRRLGLAAEPDPEQIRVIERLVERLDSDAFAERAAAEKDLFALRPEFISDLKAVVASPDLSAGVRLSLQQAAGKVAKRARITNQILSNRLHPVLGLSGSEAAEALFNVLPEVETAHCYIPPPFRTKSRSLREQLEQAQRLGALVDELPPIDGVLPPLPDAGPTKGFDDPRLDLLPQKK